MKADIKLFHESIGHELNAVKNRVRNLIGSAHWGEEGRFKEAILKSAIQNHLPSQFDIASGFVIGNQKKVTSQIDIIIFEKSFPVLFRHGDLVIINADGVRGIIEVKTKICRGDISEIVLKASNNAATILATHNDRSFSFFNGIFCFEIAENTKENVTETLSQEAKVFKNSIKNSYEQEKEEYLVNHLALGSDHFVKLWDKGLPNCLYRCYSLKNLATSYFLFNLMHCLKPDLSNSMTETMFPLDTKEIYSIGKTNVR